MAGNDHNDVSLFCFILHSLELVYKGLRLDEYVNIIDSFYNEIGEKLL